MENELVVQVSMKHEIELAMKLLEKDIHEKQDTLIGLRQQLDEVKAINMEMYQKLQVKSALWWNDFDRSKKDILPFSLDTAISLIFSFFPLYRSACFYRMLLMQTWFHTKWSLRKSLNFIGIIE